MTNQLKPGALVQHPEYGWRYVSMVLAPESGRPLTRLWLEPRVPITMAIDVLDDGSLSCGWSLVGESGFAPEGAKLAWVSCERDALLRAVDARKRKTGSRLEYDAAEFVALNPAPLESETS